ncbi:hypothetical protein KR059_009299 [Drosophila kikkawai]|nr:hypothetical protein KR059_009299 [Drosophila kikkawai]
MCLLSYASRLVFFIYGTLGPAYHTYKTLNNGDDEFLAWAKYWIVYAFLITIELVADALLSWVAIYMPIKMIFMLWIVMTAPTANVWIFDAILHPFLTKRQDQIDQFLNRGKYKFLNDSLKTLSQMCVHGRTFVRPLISHWWSKSNMALGVSHNQETLTSATGGEGAEKGQDSDASSTSVQTSRVNVCTRSSPLTSFTHIADNTENMQPALHSNRSLNELAENVISPEPSSATVRRQILRKVKTLSKKDSGASFPSQSSLTTPKNKLYDDVEDLIATSRIEPDGQDVRQHRQLGNRNRSLLSQQ